MALCSFSFASAVLDARSFEALFRSATESRASCSEEFALSSWPATLVWPASMLSLALEMLLFSVSAITPLTVETKEELMVSSSVVAPVSVTLVDTPPAFSFT